MVKMSRKVNIGINLEPPGRVLKPVERGGG
jgi:hypothetical protein